MLLFKFDYSNKFCHAANWKPNQTHTHMWPGGRSATRNGLEISRNLIHAYQYFISQLVFDILIIIRVWFVRVPIFTDKCGTHYRLYNNVIPILILYHMVFNEYIHNNTYNNDRITNSNSRIHENWPHI